MLPLKPRNYATRHTNWRYRAVVIRPLRTCFINLKKRADLSHECVYTEAGLSPLFGHVHLSGTAGGLLRKYERRRESLFHARALVEYRLG